MRRISGGMVAVKNRVWRVNGTSLQMRSMSGMKPMSSMRSASSMTRSSTPLSRSRPRSKWSSRRPGVAISTSTPRVSLVSWSSNETPPMISATLSLLLAPYLAKLSSTCAASSRVGSRISVRGMRARARPCSSMVSIGSMKAAVLPVPVCAMPSTSRRASTCGYGLILDGGGGFVTGRRDGGENFFGQAEMGEGHKPSDQGRAGTRDTYGLRRGKTRNYVESARASACPEHRVEGAESQPEALRGKLKGLLHFSLDALKQSEPPMPDPISPIACRSSWFPGLIARRGSTPSKFRRCGGSARSPSPITPATTASPLSRAGFSPRRRRALRSPASRWAATSPLRSCGRRRSGSPSWRCWIPGRARTAGTDRGAAEPRSSSPRPAASRKSPTSVSRLRAPRPS